jgi:hypothetical protein
MRRVRQGIADGALAERAAAWGPALAPPAGPADGAEGETG